MLAVIAVLLALILAGIGYIALAVARLESWLTEPPEDPMNRHRRPVPVPREDGMARGTPLSPDEAIT